MSLIWDDQPVTLKMDYAILDGIETSLDCSLTQIAEKLCDGRLRLGELAHILRHMCDLPEDVVQQLIMKNGVAKIMQELAGVMMSCLGTEDAVAADELAMMRERFPD